MAYKSACRLTFQTKGQAFPEHYLLFIRKHEHAGKIGLGPRDLGGTPYWLKRILIIMNLVRSIFTTTFCI